MRHLAGAASPKLSRSVSRFNSRGALGGMSMDDQSREESASFSNMINFQDQYRRAYESLGHPLTHREGRSQTRIRAVERRLGVHLPKALRDYYLVAGTERRFNQIFNHLYAPEEWFIDGEKLVFMEENQAVVLWATVTSLEPG